MVLVVDDAHWADPGTVAFLDTLLGGTGHVLVLATAWPDQLAVQASEPGTFGAAMSAWAEAGIARRIDLAPLPDPSLEMLVRARAPDPDQVEPQVVAALCRRAGGNPNRLEGLLSLRVVRRALASGAAGGGLTDEEIQSLPTGDREIYQAIWRELPEGVQEALALTTVQGPRFNPQWIPAAAELLDLTGAEAGLAAARAPWGWVRSLDAALDAFVEAGLFERAREEAANLFLPRELKEARAAMLAWAVARKQQDDWSALSTSARRAVLEAHVTALEDGLVEVDENVLDSVDQLTQLMSEGYELEALTALARRGSAWAEDRPALRGFWWRFRLREAMAMGESGRTEEALERTAALLAEVEEEADEGPVEVQAIRRLRAHWLMESGRLTEARAELEDLLATWLEERGPDHVLTLEARARIATCLRQEGKVPEALERLEDIVDDSVRVLGPDAHDTLLRRHELAVALMDAGRMDEALGSLRSLLASRLRLSGADAFETLNVRRSLDACLLGLARWDDAVEALRASVDDHRRVMGPDHPATLRALGHLAQALTGSGAVGEALQVQLHLAEERARVQGPDHPNTLIARHNLASTLVRAGELDAAIKLFKAVLSQRHHLFGAEHPDTMATMNNLAICYLRSGKRAEAGPLLEAVLSYRLETLGPEHPHTEAAWRNLKSWAAESGDS